MALSQLLKVIKKGLIISAFSHGFTVQCLKLKNIDMLISAHAQ